MPVFLLLVLNPIAFGLSDYFSGRLSTRINPWAVIGSTSVLSAVVALIWALVFDSVDLQPGVLAWGAASGLLLVAAFALFYSALAIGKGAVVGSIITLSIIVPIVLDRVHGTMPSRPSLAGIAAIIIGVIVIAQPRSAGRQPKSATLLALAAAAIFGVQFMALDRASQISSDTAVLVEFAVGAAAIAALGAAKRSLGGITKADVPRLLGIGMLSVIGSLTFSASLAVFNVAIASTFTNMEPLVLALCGYFLMKEKLTLVQIGALIVVVAGAAAAVLYS